MSSDYLDVPLFAGQGTAAASSPRTHQQAFLDASSLSGSLLLTACHQAFHQEVSTLSISDRKRIGIDLETFESKESLIVCPNATLSLNSPLVSGCMLLLLQSLRYLACMEASHATGQTTDACQSHEVACILGFSSGILPACIAATSVSPMSFISSTVEAFRLSIWIGIRMQSVRSTMTTWPTSDPFSLVLMGASSEIVEKAIYHFFGVYILLSNSDEVVANLPWTSCRESTLKYL
jgi:malonyl CoA-acyl carrier protein transacylase